MESSAASAIQDNNSITDSSTDSSGGWNEHQEKMLKATSERANCMRWLHNQSNLYFENLNFYFTIPNVIISTLNGSFTMSLNALFPDPNSQQAAQTVIGLISIFSAVLITMNQYVKSQQMMEAHRAAALAYGKMYRSITNELTQRRDQRSSATEFLKLIRAEQDRLESTAPSILPHIIKKFNILFADRDIEKPEIAGDLDATEINTDKKDKTRRRVDLLDGGSPIAQGLKLVGSAKDMIFRPRRAHSFIEDSAEEKKVEGDASHIYDSMQSGIDTVVSIKDAVNSKKIKG
jgi:hypothetical protein